MPYLLGTTRSITMREKDEKSKGLIIEEHKILQIQLNIP